MTVDEISKCTIQLVILDSTVEPVTDARPLGSAVLFTHNDKYYLLSAAHVFSGEKIANICYLSHSSEFVSVVSNMSFYDTANPVNYPMDIAVTDLEPIVVQSLLQDGYRFATMYDTFYANYIGKINSYLIYGFPASKTKRMRKEGIWRRSPFIFKTTLARKINIKNYDAKVNLFVDWHRKKLRTDKGLRCHGCKPNGLSGCGIWIHDGSDDYALHGIMIGYDRCECYLAATKFENVTQLIRERFDPQLPPLAVINI